MFITFKLKRAVAVAVSIAAMFVLTFSFVSCERYEDIHTRIERKYSDIQSFTATIEVIVNSRAGSNAYSSRQYFKMDESGGMFREDVLAPEELAGMTYIFAGGTMLIIPPDENESILFEDIPDNRNYTLLTEFFTRYFAQQTTEPIDESVGDASNSVPQDAESAENPTETALEVTLDGENSYRASQKLWICNDSLAPIRLETFNADGDTLVTVTFTEFELNARIDEEIFSDL